MEIDVVNPGKTGLLGIGAEPATVRVTLPEPQPQTTQPDPNNTDNPDPDTQPDHLADYTPPFTNQLNQDLNDDYDDEEDDEDDYQDDYDEETHPTVQTGYQILSTLLTQMGVSADVYLREPYTGDPEGPVFEIEGDDSGLLIGTRGETLRSLQFIVSYLVSRKLGQRTNLTVDVEGYQKRRYDSIANLARRVAQRVAQRQRAIPLEPMPPNERRQVHMALANRNDVKTESDGHGDRRKVVIHPK